MDAEDSLEGSLEGLVKVAARKYTKLAGQGTTHYSPECAGLNFIFSKKDFAYFLEACCKLLPS